MATATDGNKILAVNLHRTVLSDFQELIEHAVRPTLTELEGPLVAK